MDVGIRAANWIAALALLPSAPWMDEVAASLLLHGRFIRSHLETHIARGNHYLSDVVGLLVVAAMFAGGAEGQAWLSWGADQLEGEMAHQVRPDGAHHEMALAYHRLVAEELLSGSQVVAALAPGRPSPAFHDRLGRMLDLIADVTRPDGLVPAAGDADDGRFLPLGDYGRADPQAQLGLLLRAGRDPVAGSRSAAYPDGGWWVLRAGEAYVLARCGDVGVDGEGTHAHNDLLAFELALGDQPLIVDPGSYVYTPDPAARNAFRATAAHATLRIGDAEQRPIPTDGLFSLRDVPQRLIAWEPGADGGGRWVAEHEGFPALPGPHTPSPRARARPGRDDARDHRHRRARGAADARVGLSARARRLGVGRRRGCRGPGRRRRAAFRGRGRRVERRGRPRLALLRRGRGGTGRARAPRRAGRQLADGLPAHRVRAGGEGPHGMRQLVQDLRSGTVEVLEVPDPRPGPGQVLLRTRWSVISPGTEQTITETASKSLVGKALDRPDQVRKVLEKTLRDGPGSALAAVRARLDDLLTPGYSSMGVVEAVGSGVEGFAPGDRVGAVGANFACHAELAVVPAPLCLRLPDGVEDRAGAFGALGAIAAHGLRVGEVQAGHVVAVIGLGLIGQLAAQLATAAGARVVAIDLDPTRVDLARTLGAVGGATGGATEARAAVDAASDGAGADVVVIAAGTKDAGPLELAAELAADRAVVSVIGDVPIDAPRTPLYLKELQVRLSRSYGPGRYDPAYEEEGHDYPRGFVRWTERRLIGYVFQEIARGRVTIEPLVSHEFSLDDGELAYEALGEPGRMAILLRHPAPETGTPPPPAGRSRVTLASPAPDGATAGSGGPARIGLIGPGLFARSTLIPVLERAGAELVAVGGRAGARAVGVARRSGARWTTADPEEIIADPGIDAVVIATRHDTHASLAARALAAGKAVLVEKPLAVDADALAELEPHLGRWRPPRRRLQPLMRAGHAPPAEPVRRSRRAGPRPCAGQRRHAAPRALAPRPQGRRGARRRRGLPLRRSLLGPRRLVGAHRAGPRARSERTAHAPGRHVLGHADLRRRLAGGDRLRRRRPRRHGQGARRDDGRGPRRVDRRLAPRAPARLRANAAAGAAGARAGQGP